MVKIKPPAQRAYAPEGKAKISTTGIYRIFRGLKFEPDAEIGQKGAFFKGLKGFTLIEILVAISILSISLVVILQLFSGGLKSSRLSDKYTKGIFHAKEKMEEILLGTEFAEEVSEGEFGDSYRWRSEIVRIEQSEEEASKLPFNTFNIQVDVVWDEGDKEKRFSISTLKVVEKKKGDESKN